jgi:hypothetical protein
VEVAGGGSSAGAAGVQASDWEGVVLATSLGGLIYPSASLLLGEGRENTLWYDAQGEDRGLSGGPTGSSPGRSGATSGRLVERGGRIPTRLGARASWGRRGRRGGGGEARAASRSGAERFHCAPVCLRFPPDFEIEVHQSVNRKVVDLTTLYNFYKGSRVFFSTDFAGTSRQL